MKRPATVAALFVLFSANGAAQAQQEPAPETFGETIDVRVVNVDVWVTDRDGNPVTGLVAGDFEVREDGRPVELSNFFEFTDGLDASARERSAPTPRDRRPRQSDLDRFIPAEPPPPEHRLSLMVYVDNNNLTPTDRNRLLPFLRNFLSVQLSPYDRAMLAVYDAGRFEVALPFTTEAWRVAEATHEVARVVGSRDRIESQRLDILRELNRDDEVPPRYSAVVELIRDFAAMIRSEVDASIVNLENAIRTMAGLPGRKAILYISNGLPMRPAEDLFRALEERFDDRRGRWQAINPSPFRDVDLYRDTRGIDAANASLEAYQYDLSRRFDELASLANANGVTFHSVAAAGARVSGMNTADLRFSTSIEFTRAANLEEPLLRLADRTGGRAIVNTRNFAGGFDRIASDLQNRYSLGYSPTHIERGSTHRIEVELTDEAKRRYRGRLSIRHRDSYVDKSVSAEMADLTLAALSMEEAANPIGVRIAPVRGPGSEAELESGDIQSRMLVAIPIGPLTLAPVADGHEAQVRLWVQVIDGEGRVSEVTEHPVPVLVKEGEIEDARELSWPFAVDVVTAPGPHRVAVGVRDDLAATTSVVTFDLDAGNAPTAVEATAAVTEAPPPSDTPRVVARRGGGALPTVGVRTDGRRRPPGTGADGRHPFAHAGLERARRGPLRQTRPHRAGRGRGRGRLPPRDRGHGRRGVRGAALQPRQAAGRLRPLRRGSRRGQEHPGDLAGGSDPRPGEDPGLSLAGFGRRRRQPGPQAGRDDLPGRPRVHRRSDPGGRRGRRRPRRQHRRGRLRRRCRGAGTVAPWPHRERRRGDETGGFSAGDGGRRTGGG